MSKIRVAFGALMLSIVASLVVGCDRDEPVRAYQAPKEPARSPVAMAAPNEAEQTVPVSTPPHDAAGQTSSDDVQWQVPAGWKQLPGSQMRKASFQVLPDDPNIQLSVIPLGPENTLLPNVNRWQGQVGLAPTPESELPKIVQTVELASGEEAQVIDLIGPPDKGAQRILAALVTRPDKVWFFKLQGPSDKLETQKQNFDAFIRSVKFDDGTATAGPSASAGASAASPSGGAGGATWTVPADWTQQPDKPMRLATFTAGADPSPAEVIITRFPANSGSLLDNINRWRTQAGLEPITDPMQQPKESITVNGHAGDLYDFASAQRRIRVAMVAVGEESWFFKMQGTPDGVEKQKAAFDEFLASVRLP